MIYKLFGIRFPLAIFIILILAFSISGYSLINFTLMKYLTEDGERIWVETDFLRLEYPRGWYAVKWENETIYVMNLLSAESEVIMYLGFYKDEEATRTFMENNGLTNETSVSIFEADRLYRWVLERVNENATRSFLENKTINVSFLENKTIVYREAPSMTIQINNAFKKEDTFYNVTVTLISLIFQQKLLEIIFYGENSAWNNTYSDFQSILNLLVIKSEP